MKVNAGRKNVEFDTAAAREITEKIQQARRAGKRIAFVYDRVSSDQQGEGMSFDYQSDNAAGYARRAGLEVVHCISKKQSEHTRETRLALACDHDALTKNINEIVDKVLTFPDCLLTATPDKRVVIVRELADHVVWERKTLKVAWKKPCAVFMTPEFQTLMSDIEDFASRMRPARILPSACHWPG